MVDTHSRRPAEIWPLVYAERAALATDVMDLTDEQWSTRSLCSDLSVREVLAHLTAAANLNGLRWFAGVVRCRFDFDKQVVMRLVEQLGNAPAETLERFRRAATSKTKPPLPVIAMLGETIVHGEDIRYPLGIHHDSPIATLTPIAEYYRNTDQDYRLLARLYPLINTDTRITKYRDGFALFGSVYTTLFKKSSDEERKERLSELGPMVLEIINAHVHSFSVAATQEEALVLDAQGITILKELLALVRPTPGKDDEDKTPPSAAEILDRIKTALENGVEPGSAKYTALAERIKQLRDRIIQNAQDALDFLSEALRVAHAIVNAEKHPDEAVVVPDDDHVGVLSRIIHDHAPPGLTVTERNLAEEIDQVVTRTLARSWDNADARNRGVRRATAAVFRRYALKPVGEPYDSTVAYIEAHYLVD